MKHIYSGFLSGICISLGAIVNLTLGGLAGSVMFSLGLLIICWMGLDLYTGKIGYVLEPNGLTPIELFEVLAGNGAGCVMSVYAIMVTPKYEQLFSAATNAVTTKINNGAIANFFLAMFCGILVYVAVDIFKSTKNPLAIVFPITTFVVCGFNHCIADMFYTALVNDGFATLIPTIIGNSVGAIIFNHLKQCISLPIHS